MLECDAAPPTPLVFKIETDEFEEDDDDGAEFMFVTKTLLLGTIMFELAMLCC